MLASLSESEDTRAVLVMLVELSLVGVAGVSVSELAVAVEHRVLELALVGQVVLARELKPALAPVQLLQLAHRPRVLSEGRPEIVQNAFSALPVVLKFTLVSNVLGCYEKLA